MKIAIIGAGFAGLSAAYQLSKKGHLVTVYEKDPLPGGLAVGYKEKVWEWSLEKHYHHWFANDDYILNLAKVIDHEVLIPRPKTSIYIGGGIYQLDSPLSLLRFPRLPMSSKIRVASVLGFLRFNPYWQPLERIHAESFLKKTMGEKGYEILWKPQFHNKFGQYVSEISLAWFWARIRKRTASLAYPEGGFLRFAQHLVASIENNGGKVFFNTEIRELLDENKIKVNTIINGKKNSSIFDKAIVTLPSFLFLKIAPQLPEIYKRSLMRLKGLGAINLVLRLKEPFLTDKTYWLSVCDEASPVMAIVEHTNFMDKKHYNNEHIVYLGNYLPMDHPNFNKDAAELLKLYTPFLKKINPNFQFSILNSQLFKAPFAQPIIPVNYSKLLPPMHTPLANVYLANIEQVYPWDRGTNYAVELGEKAATLVTSD